MRVVVEKNVQGKYGPNIGRLFNETSIGNARHDTTPLFRQSGWRELGFPRDLWRAAMLFGGHPEEPSEYALERARAWTAWMETVSETGTTEIVMVKMPLYTGDSERQTVAIVPLGWDSILKAGHAVDIFACDEWLVFDASETWAMRCHWEGISILGASPEWMQRFRARYGNLAPLKTMFEDIVDSEFSAGDYAETGDAIKAGVRWPAD